jgi:hypothetical protein
MVQRLHLVVGAVSVADVLVVMAKQQLSLAAVALAVHAALHSATVVGSVVIAASVLAVQTSAAYSQVYPVSAETVVAMMAKIAKDFILLVVCLIN